MTKYEAAWSQNNWIGKNGSFFDFSAINMLSEWTDMGIAYATTRTDDYWGVINHVNEEGFFRIADRNITKGMKLWTWGKDAINANKFSIANGGRDDYIELWGGTVMHFFDDAILNSGSQLNWSEYFYPTVALPGVTAMNNQGGAFMNLNKNSGSSNYDFKLNYFLTNQNQNYSVDLFVNGNINPAVSQNFKSNSVGNTVNQSIASNNFINGNNTLIANLKNESGQIVLVTQKQFNLTNTEVSLIGESNLKILNNSRNQIEFLFEYEQSVECQIYTCDGKQVYQSGIQSGMKVNLPNSGIYIIKINFNNQVLIRKIIVD